MSFFRSFLILTFVSLFTAVVLFFLASVMGQVDYSGGYAVLETSAEIEDSSILQLLSAGGKKFAGSPVCESSQWVFLDEFGSIEKIPLNQYGSRLFPFDPRNDGYAGKLKNIFVRDGRRFVYIPLKPGNAGPSFNKKLNSLLSGIPYSVSYFGIGKPVAFFFITYAAAVLLLVIICLVKKNTHPGAANIIALIPVFSSLAFFGAGGTAVAALFFGLFVMLAEPFKDIIAGGVKGIKTVYKEIIEPYRYYWFLLLAFALVTAVFAFFSRLNILFLLAVFAVSCALFFFSMKTFFILGNKHRRFIPLLIIRKQIPDFAFSLYMLPVVAAAFFMMIFTPFLPGSPVSSNQFEYIVEEKDYYSHLAFQTSFSVKQLSNDDISYPAYLPGEDGLPAVDLTYNPVSLVLSVEDYPPFPLKNLMDFFDGVNKGKKVTAQGSGGIAEKLSLLLLLFFILPMFLFKGKTPVQRGNFTGGKRLTANKDINRKKVLLYNGKTNLRLRKDA